MMKQYRLAFCGWLLAAIGLTGCVANDTETGGNTSWLQCTTHAQCPDGQHCNLSTELCEAGPVPDAGPGGGVTLNADCVACLATGKVWIPEEPLCVDQCFEDSSCFYDMCPEACTPESCSCFKQSDCEAAGCHWYEDVTDFFPVNSCEPTERETIEPLEAGATSEHEAGTSSVKDDSGVITATEQTESMNEPIEAGALDAAAPMSIDASSTTNPAPLDADCTACLVTGKVWVPGDPHECVDECYQDTSCFTEECPAACSAETCSCFNEAACEDVGCVWSVGTSGGWPVTSCDRERPAFFRDAGEAEATADAATDAAALD